MIYKTEISFWGRVVLFALIGGLSVWFLIDELWVAFIGNLLLSGFVMHLILTTYYTINGNTLNVHCGFFYNTDIDIATIKSITETNSLLSAPALSADRIEICYNKWDTVVISPPHKLEFIEQLKAINNNIEINTKQKKSTK